MSVNFLTKLSKTATNLSNRRYYANGKLKELFYENKQLYGAVIKDSQPSPKWNVNSNNQASELYWLLQQQSMKIVEKPIEPIVNKTVPVENRASGDAIPFQNDDLKLILDYPMVCKPNDFIGAQAPETKLRLPSVGKVLQATMSESSRAALKRWKLDKIAELGMDGFHEYQKQVFRTGSMFHSAIENFLNDRTEPEDSPQISHLWNSIRNELQHVESKPLFTEKALIHKQLCYRGIVDCVSMVKYV